MRNLREAVVILAAVALVGLAAHGLSLAASHVTGGLDGWASLAAVAVAGIATFLALVSSTLAAFVVRRRPWRVALGVVTALGLAWVAVVAVSTADLDEVLAALAYATVLALALWLPVLGRWWLDRLATEPVADAPAVSRRSAVTAAALCGGVVVVVCLITLAVAGGSVPSSLIGFALVLIAAAAIVSGRVPESTALVLLAGVGLSALLFALPALPDGGLVTGALALVVLVAFSWRPLAARLTAARDAVVPVIPASGEPDLDAPQD